MIYIGTAEFDGSAIYFDAYAAERQGRGVCVSGTVGDGCYEGEVLVEVGRFEEVTFADAWLGGSGFSEFLSRCGTEVLERSLIEAVREMPIFKPRRSTPHRNSLPCAATSVAESSSSWNKRA